MFYLPFFFFSLLFFCFEPRFVSCFSRSLQPFLRSVSLTLLFLLLLWKDTHTTQLSFFFLTCFSSVWGTHLFLAQRSMSPREASSAQPCVTSPNGVTACRSPLERPMHCASPAVYWVVAPLFAHWRRTVHGVLTHIGGKVDWWKSECLVTIPDLLWMENFLFRS